MTEPLSIYQREVWTTFDHHLRWSVFCRILHAIIILRYSLMGEERWRVVKSCGNSSPRQTPCLSGFAREGWRVKSIWQNSLPLHSVAWFCCLILLLDTVATPYHSTLSLHSFCLFSECDCKSTQFPRRFQLFPTIPLRFSCKWGKKKSQRGKEWGKRRTPEEKRRITEKILRNQRK